MNTKTTQQSWYKVAEPGELPEGRVKTVTAGVHSMAFVEQNLLSAGAPAYFSELGPYLTGRLAIQFNGYMPVRLWMVEGG